jgi:uncharacterized membrane protein
MKLSYLLHGLPGHPIHPPLTDATIGIYTFATIAGFLEVVGITENNGAIGWYLGLVIGLITTVPTALTGLMDWLSIERGTELWRTATSHMIAMLAATVFFALATILGNDGYHQNNITGGSYVLTLVGFGLLTLGGWLGGTIVYVHGMRVLNLVKEPTERAVSPIPHPEKDLAEG